MNLKKTVISVSIILLSVSFLNAQSEECENAISDAESYAYDLERASKKLRHCASNENASDLERRAKKLQSCASYSDSTDDCYYEFRKVKREYSNAEVCYYEYKKVKNIFSDYESSVSDVSSYCD
jgi:hypothetical protein